MKNSLIASSVFCILFFLGLNSLSAQVKTVSLNYYPTSSFRTDVDNHPISSFATEVAAFIKEVKRSGFTLVDYDIITLSRYQEFPWDLTCYAGREYVVFGYTEQGVKDLALYIYDNKGKYVTADSYTKNDGITFAKFNAYSTTKARIIAKNENSKKALKNYKVAIIVAYRYR